MVGDRCIVWARNDTVAGPKPLQVAARRHPFDKGALTKRHACVALNGVGISRLKSFKWFLRPWPSTRDDAVTHIPIDEGDAKTSAREMESTRDCYSTVPLSGGPYSFSNSRFSKDNASHFATKPIVVHMR